MIRVITSIVLFICTALTAQTQYQTGMQNAFALWDLGKNTEASAAFERIAATEKTNWLPLYYVALVNTTEAFTIKDKQSLTTLLTKAQAAQDSAVALSPNNPELMITQAMIYTAWIVFDPMTNGMKLSGKVNELYAQALILAPDNPRVVYCNAEFQIGGAKYFGTDVKAMCAEVERSIGLFANFKPETPFSPTWGKDRAEEKLKECQK